MRRQPIEDQSCYHYPVKRSRQQPIQPQTLLQPTQRLLWTAASPLRRLKLSHRPTTKVRVSYQLNYHPFSKKVEGGCKNTLCRLLVSSCEETYLFIKFKGDIAILISVCRSCLSLVFCLFFVWKFVLPLKHCKHFEIYKVNRPLRDYVDSIKTVDILRITWLHKFTLPHI